MVTRRGAASAALATVLLVALGLRLYDIGFGLPSLYDPDEPIFMVVALKLLKQHTLNPGWFGHPGTTTIYLVALIDLVVFGSGVLSGRFAGVHDFAAAAYADPSLLFLPARIAMAIFGVSCVWLTFVLGRRLFGSVAGLIGAALLAVNSLHILWSQVIRTDVMASLFMLASLIFSARASEDGKTKDYVLAGAFIGVAAATKWPSAIVMVGLAGAAVRRIRSPSGQTRIEVHKLAAALAVSLLALFVSSPYIFIDWQTVLANVSGEIAPRHLGQTGAGFFQNLAWYVFVQAGDSMGTLALVLVLAGSVVAAMRFPIARWTLLPVAAAFLILIAGQSMIWSRWLVPELPLFCILAALAITKIGEIISQLFRWTNPHLGVGLLALVAAIPSIASARDRIAERRTDTRSVAAAWAVAHLPRRSTVLLEHLELRLRTQPWHFLFPIGEAGCVDAIKAIQGGMTYEQVQQMRRGSPIVDLGNVDPKKLHSCRADFAIVTYYDEYLKERTDFPNQVANYRRLFEGGRTVALFRPSKGKVGGPVVRIVALAQQSKSHPENIPRRP